MPFQGLAKGVCNAGDGKIVAGWPHSSGRKHHLVLGGYCSDLSTDSSHLITHNCHLQKQINWLISHVACAIAQNMSGITCCRLGFCHHPSCLSMQPWHCQDADALSGLHSSK